jgi:hypothetical protein
MRRIIFSRRKAIGVIRSEVMELGMGPLKCHSLRIIRRATENPPNPTPYVGYSPTRCLCRKTVLSPGGGEGVGKKTNKVGM